MAADSLVSLARRTLQKLNPSTPLFRYLAAGVGAFSVEYGSFCGMYFGLDWPLYLANSISFGLGLLTSFGLNRLWTFKHDTYHKKTGHQFGLYVGLALTNLLLTNLLVEGFARIGIDPEIGKLIAMITTSIWNYALFKTVIFAKHKDTPPKVD